MHIDHEAAQPLARSRRSRWLSVVGAAVAVSLTIPLAAAPPASAQPAAVSAQVSPVVATDAQVSGLPPEAGPIAKWLAEKIAGAAAGKAASWVMDAIGFSDLFPNPTLDKLNEISQKLDQISQQITQVQASVDSLTADVAQGELSAQLRDLRTHGNQIRDLYDNVFQPVVDAATELAQARQAKQDTTDAEKKLAAARTRFISLYDANNAVYGPLANNVHDFLVPSEATSVLKAKGRVLMSTNRYLTSAQSQELLSLYEALADIEAFAVWIQVERYVSENRKTAQSIVDKYQGWRKAEQRNLPDPIPDDVVIDVGAPQSDRKTTNGKLMWLPAERSGQVSGTPGSPYGVDGTVAAMNKAKTLTYGDWQLPSQADLTGLYAGPGGFDPKTSKTLTGFLRGLNSKSARWQWIKDDTWDHIFSGTLTNQPMECYRLIIFAHVNRYYGKYPTYSAVSGKNAAWRLYPALPASVHHNEYATTAISKQDCDFMADQAFRNRANDGGVIASRTVTPTPQDFMAQGAALPVIKAVQRRSKIRVKVNHYLKGSRSWKFQVHKVRPKAKRQGSGAKKWRKLGTFRATSKKRIVNLPQGRYRVVVKDKYGLIGGTSPTVRLRR